METPVFPKTLRNVIIVSAIFAFLIGFFGVSGKSDKETQALLCAIGFFALSIAAVVNFNLFKSYLFYLKRKNCEGENKKVVIDGAQAAGIRFVIRIVVGGILFSDWVFNAGIFEYLIIAKIERGLLFLAIVLEIVDVMRQLFLEVWFSKIGKNNS